jgi:hypothetical protein
MQMRTFAGFGARAVLTIAAVLFVTVSSALGVAARRFEIVTFEWPGTPAQHLGQAQFDHLNNVTANGKFLAMGSDAHRPQVNNNGNFLAIYYNTLNDGYGSITGAQKADQIRTLALANFTSNGVVPQWIILNELSAGSWPGDQTYRNWVNNCVQRLSVTYGHSVIVCAPFSAPANNAGDWQTLASNSYIAIEKYLTGAAINANGNSVAWCQAQYQAAKNAYLNLGIPASKLYLVEHFAQTTTGTNRGRAGVSYAGWDNAIKARADAAKNVGFAGFVSYAWAFNQMLVSDADLLHFEDTYRAKALP